MSDSNSKTSSDNSVTLRKSFLNKFLNQIYKWFHKSKLRQRNLRTYLLELLDKEKNNTSITMTERQMLVNTLSFGGRTVREVMIPRSDIVALERKTSGTELQRIIVESKHTRLPVYNQTLDDIIGFIHIKDILKGIVEKDFRIDNILIALPSVTPNLALNELFSKMRNSRIHMALVIDEYGGVDGLVTIDDLVEQIMGPIDDEHDKINEPEYQKIDENLVEVNARLSLKELGELFNIEFEEETLKDIDTVGGLILSLVGHIPIKGEKIMLGEELEFEIMEADSRVIKKVKIRKRKSLNVHQV